MVSDAVKSDRSIIRQMEAAKELLKNLRDSGEDDAELITDTIEGETNLFEALDRALSQIDECEILIFGLKEKEKSFEGRRKQISDRADRIRALIEQAMIATEQKSIKLPSATLSIATRAPSVVISNEGDIPARFWTEQPRPAPKLDKAALKAALNGKEVVPGAALDNGSISLTVLRK